MKAIDRRVLGGFLVLFLIVIGLIIVGVGIPWDSNEHSDKNDQTPYMVDHNYINYHQSEEGNIFDSDPVEPPLVMEGEIHMGGFGTKQDEFSNVSVHFYDEDGSSMNGTCLGTLGRPLDVSVTSPELPKYIVFNSPEFWNKETAREFQVEYMEHTGGEYRVRSAYQRDDFPVDVTRHDPCEDS